MGRPLANWTKHHSSSSHLNRPPPALRLYSDLVAYLLLIISEIETNRCVWHRTIVSMSQTCTKWRRTALDVKRLWATMVDFESGLEAWNEELLERSLPLPIDIVSPSLKARSTTTIKRELQHLPRIKSYRINFDDTACSALIESLDRPSPILQRLTLARRPSRNSKHLLFPPTFLGRHAPNLRRLELVRCSIDFQSPAVERLTRLTVLDLDPTMAPTANEWLGHLSRMPHLIKLTIQNAISPLRSTAIPAQRHSKVKLSSLILLELEASLPRLAVLVSNLAIPPQCDINVVATHATEGVELETLVGVIRQALIYAYSTDKPTSCPLSILARGTALSFTNEPPSGGFEGEASTPPTSPIVYLCLDTVPTSTWEAIFSPVLTLLGDLFPSVTSLELHLSSHLSYLIPYLAGAQNVKSLTNLTSVVTKKALQSLQVVGEEDVPGGTGIPLPSLETVLFTDDESMWGNAYTAFVSFLRWRLSISKPIKRVVFDRCFILTERLESLKELGVAVECDTRGVDWRHL